MTSRLVDLFRECGQSPWLDNLQRRYLQSGYLKSLVESGIRGLTSNPTIFQKAIEGSADYDEQFEQEIRRGLTTRDAYWEMVIRDIIDALDVFVPLYETSEGTDGFVSVEVDPVLAHDTEGTVASACDLHRRIDRPNVMIKVPATTEGVPAVRRLISLGINVNVTLIFSLARYAEVVDAYLCGLEDRQREGRDIASVASVASFFISRVDSEVDSRLLAVDRPDLMGRAAIAQAHQVFRTFTHTFDPSTHPRWSRLHNGGARPQRPLWASTSTKNPYYPDTLYVDSLIGPGTVNTLPEPTMEAFVHHGVAAETLQSVRPGDADVWPQLQSLGINMEEVAGKLEAEGVAAFTKSFNDLIDTLESKARSLR